MESGSLFIRKTDGTQEFSIIPPAPLTCRLSAQGTGTYNYFGAEKEHQWGQTRLININGVRLD
jgi:hypothetical protein